MLKNEFWNEINEPFTSEMTLVIQNCQDILLNGFSANASEEHDFCRKFKEDIKVYCQDTLKKLF